jgi:hypothetical protein
MNSLIRLGALNIDNKYVLPNDASKNEKYKCPDCPENVFLKTGSIKKYHFSHYPSSNCNFYKKNNKSTIHNHCQYLLKKIFESSFKFIIKSCCVSCGFKKNKEILTKDCQMHIEYEYIYKDSKKKIDCAIVKDNEPIEFIEVYNTHRTKDEDRPFFIEISVENILEYDINEKFEEYYFNDIKHFECNNCILNKNRRIEEHNRKIKLKKEKKLKYIYWLQKQEEREIEQKIREHEENELKGLDDECFIEMSNNFLNENKWIKKEVDASSSQSNDTVICTNDDKNFGLNKWLKEEEEEEEEYINKPIKYGLIIRNEQDRIFNDLICNGIY